MQIAANIHLYHVHTEYFCLIFLSPVYRCMVLYMHTVGLGGGYVDREVSERVMLERVEMIARLLTEGGRRERDREIALSLIVDLVEYKDIANSRKRRNMMTEE